jgi:hypothetical protein
MADPAWTEAGGWAMVGAMAVLAVWLMLPTFQARWRKFRGTVPSNYMLPLLLPTTDVVAARERWPWHDEDWAWSGW